MKEWDHIIHVRWIFNTLCAYFLFLVLFSFFMKNFH